jgi:hypothetical protein
MGWTGDLAPYYHLLDTKHWWDSLPIVVVIDDGDGYRSIYAHEYQVTVKPGQHVKAGQVIGYEGATGNASGCHVHFGLFSPTETATFAARSGGRREGPDARVRDRPDRPAAGPAVPLRVEEMRTLRPIEAAPCPPLPIAERIGEGQGDGHRQDVLRSNRRTAIPDFLTHRGIRRRPGSGAAAPTPLDGTAEPRASMRAVSPEPR